MACSLLPSESLCVDHMCPLRPRIVHMVPRLAANPDFGTEPAYEDHSEFFRAGGADCSCNQSFLASLCEYCNHLQLQHLLICLRKFGSDAYPLIELDSLSKIRERRDCSFCSMVSNMFESSRYDRSDDIVFMFPFIKSMETLLRRIIHVKDGTIPEVMFFLPTEAYYTQDIFAIGVERYARVVYSPRNSGLMRDECKPLHNGLNQEKLLEWIKQSFTCYNGMPNSLKDVPIDFRAIDIFKNCISTPPSHMPYAALSYVWGKPQPDEVELKLSNISSLGTPGSLSTLDLPKSISDAIKLCRSFSVPYLWVDRLCIAQDDTAAKHNQISVMDVIFSRAVFTICATAGTSSRHGLPGIGTTQRRFARKKMVLDENHLIEPIMPGIPECVTDGIWGERGWCFQEILFGGPLLLFTEWQVFFRNQDNLILPEDDTTQIEHHWILENLEARDIERRRGKINIRSNFQRYSNFVQHYVSRQLSFVSDTFAAFAGVFRSLYGDIDEYICGMPEKDFDSCVMWKAQLGSALDLPELFDNAILPSWSWGFLMHWPQAKMYHSAGVVATVARWAYLLPNGQPRLLRAVNDPTAHTSSRQWERGPRGPYSFDSPRRYLLAAWPTCIEAPSPRLDKAYRSSETILEEQWPTYAHFWHAAFDSTPFPLEPLQASILAKSPSRIAVRSTTNSFRLWVAPTPVGRSQDFYIIGPHDRCIGSCSIPPAIAAYHSLPSQGLIENHGLTFLALSIKFEGKAWWFDDLKRYLPKEESREVLKILPMLRNSPPYTELRDPRTDEVLKSHPVLNVMLLGWRGDVAHRIWLGNISLACWIQFNPKFQTIVLE